MICAAGERPLEMPMTTFCCICDKRLSWEFYATLGLSCDSAVLGPARLTRGLAPQGERKKPSVSTLGIDAPAVESRQGRQKHMIAARFFRPFGTWLAFDLVSQR